MTQQFLLNPPMPDILAPWLHYLALLHCRPGDRVLDVGCDTGDAVRFLLQSCPSLATAVGLNRSTAAIARGMQALGAYDPSSLHFVAGDGMALPFADGAFSRIICADTLEWIAAPLLSVKEMRRVLARDGLLLLVHTDFDMQTFAGPDPDLTRRIVHAFSDSGPDGTIGRRLPALARKAGFSSAATSVYTLINETYAPGTYAWNIVELTCRWLFAKRLFTEHELVDWRHSMVDTAQRGEFWYSINRILCLCRR